MSNLPFESEGPVYTDERSDAPSVTEKGASKSLDAAHPPVRQNLDDNANLQQKPKPVFRQKDDVVTSERESPSQAVRDAYQDS